MREIAQGAIITTLILLDVKSAASSRNIMPTVYHIVVAPNWIVRHNYNA